MTDQELADEMSYVRPDPPVEEPQSVKDLRERITIATYPHFLTTHPDVAQAAKDAVDSAYYLIKELNGTH